MDKIFDTTVAVAASEVAFSVSPGKHYVFTTRINQSGASGPAQVTFRNGGVAVPLTDGSVAGFFRAGRDVGDVAYFGVGASVAYADVYVFSDRFYGKIHGTNGDPRNYYFGRDVAIDEVVFSFTAGNVAVGSEFLVFEEALQ